MERTAGSRVSVIIAAANEEAMIAGAVRSAFSAGASEVIVADGASEDATVANARAAGADVVECARMRARQLNAGALAATGDILLFLHADTTLPAGACAAAVAAIESGRLFGGFRIRFAEHATVLRMAERLINLRTRLNRCPWGDQAQFVSAAVFRADGGFREIPLMEDYELAVRMKRRRRNVVLPLYVTTSGRRFLRRGVISTVATNWLIVFAYRAGVSPERLARWYRGSRART